MLDGTYNIKIHCYLCRDGCVKLNVGILWNVLSLFVYFVSQCLHPSTHPYIFGRFLLEIFLNFSML